VLSEQEVTPSQAILANRNPATIMNWDKLSYKSCTLSLAHLGGGHVFAGVIPEDGSRLLVVSPVESRVIQKEKPRKRVAEEYKQEVQDAELIEKRSLKIFLSLPALEVSLIKDNVLDRRIRDLTRRELLLISLVRPSLAITSMPSKLFLETYLGNIQVDNYVGDAVYPVIVTRVDWEGFRELEDSRNSRRGDKNKRRRKQGDNQKEEEKEEEKALPELLHLSIVQKKTEKDQSLMEYVGFRLLPLSVEVDTNTLFTLLDFFAPLKLRRLDEAIAMRNPSQWLSMFTEELFTQDALVSDYGSADSADRISSPCEVDVYGARLKAKRAKTYYENLVLHPMKATLSFLPLHTLEPSSASSKHHLSAALLNLVSSLGRINEVDIRLSSFICEHAMESPGSLVGRILSFFKWQLLAQGLVLAGSLSILGSPAGLIQNLGTGVSDFFYEPAKGAVESPLDFAIGFGKGTTSLVQHVVGGALGTVTGVMSNVNDSLALLSGDAEYARERQLKRAKQAAQKEGAVDSVLGGGESIVRGVKDGLVGLVTSPLEGAQQEGFFGFVKGTARGVTGLVTKPVIGVVDGVQDIVGGISNTITDSSGKMPLRFRRAFPVPLLPFERQSSSSSSHLNLQEASASMSIGRGMISPYSFEAGYAQFLLETVFKDRLVHSLLLNCSERSKDKAVLVLCGERRLYALKFAPVLEYMASHSSYRTLKHYASTKTSSLSRKINQAKSDDLSKLLLLHKRWSRVSYFSVSNRRDRSVHISFVNGTDYGLETTTPKLLYRLLEGFADRMATPSMVVPYASIYQKRQQSSSGSEAPSSSSPFLFRASSSLEEEQKLERDGSTRQVEDGASLSVFFRFGREEYPEEITTIRDESITSDAIRERLQAYFQDKAQKADFEQLDRGLFFASNLWKKQRPRQRKACLLLALINKVEDGRDVRIASIVCQSGLDRAEVLPVGPRSSGADVNVIGAGEAVLIFGIGEKSALSALSLSEATPPLMVVDFEDGESVQVSGKVTKCAVLSGSSIRSDRRPLDVEFAEKTVSKSWNRFVVILK
jgi:hypothetical protein